MTTETMTLTVGKPLGVTPPFEGYMPVLNGSSFSIIAFFSRVTIQDRKDWLVGKAQYGLYSENGIPIFLLDLGKTWSLDVYFNMLQENKNQRSQFLEGVQEDTKILLVLVSFPDAIVQCIRGIIIELKIMLALKEVCFDQLSRYSTQKDCSLAAKKILQAKDSKALRKEVQLNQI